jgi:hypothetical protein
VPALPDTSEGAAPALALLCELCEQDPPVLDGAALAEQLPETARLLIDLGALGRTANATVVNCRACDEPHPAEIEFDDRTRAHRHYCLVSGWVDVPAVDLMRYELDLEWLVNQLSATLNIKPRPKCLIDGILWDLGEARAGMRSWTGLFGRRLWIDRNLDRVFDALATRAGRPPGLVLTTTEGPSSRIELPGGHRLLPLNDCAHLSTDRLVIDHRVIVAGLERTGGRGQWRTGTQGRPTARHLYVAEHQRRMNSGEAEDRLADEALHLFHWMREQHPDMPPATLGTIKNNIRDSHRKWRAANPRN